MIESLGNEVRFLAIEKGTDDALSIQCEKKDIDKKNDSWLETQWNRVKGKILGRNLRRVFYEFRNSTGLNSVNGDEHFDTCVIGSDEVFNCLQKSKWGFSSQLFGKVEAAERVITYAASCGSTKVDDLSDELREAIKSAMSNLSVVSVRDKNTADFVEKISEKKPVYNLDPVAVGNFDDEIRNVTVNSKLPKKYCIVYSYAERFSDPEESQLYLCDLRGKELLIYYSIGNVLHTFFIAVLNILFLLVFKEGVDGYLKAYIIANTLTAIYAIIVGKGYKSFSFSRIDRNLLIKMARYSVVLIPNSFMWWIMNSSDRIMVSSMISVAANGIYAVSYKFPTLVSTLTTIFNQAWSYSAIREEGTDDESEYNNKIFRVLIGIVMLIGIGLLTFMKPFLSVYVGKEYYSAWKYTPFLTVGCVYLTMASFMATSYTVHKDSFGYLFSGTFGAIFNIAMNFILIPQVGVYGAAIATCISYILVFVFRLFHTRKYIQYNINNKEFIVGSTALVLSAGLMFIDNRFGFLLQCVILAVTIYLFSDIWLPIVRKILKLKGR